MKSILRLAVLLLLVASARGAGAASGYEREIQSWREHRATQLTKPDGWLTLIGLHFLAQGDNTVGTAADNSIVIAKGPAHLGTFTLGDDGRVKAVFTPGLGVQVDGQEVMAARLNDDRQTASSLVQCGTVGILLIDRGGKKALRVRDSESERRKNFAGLDYFPIDPSWRIEAQWVPFDRPREVPIHDIIGNVSPAIILGKAVFVRDGHTIELLPIQDDPEGVLFFVISDLTSGDQTYEAARFLYAAPAVDGKVILDFNKAENPPCAFTAFATCPLPPPENKIPLAVTAGERKYRGSHH